jgi:transposase InsO family protein
VRVRGGAGHRDRTRRRAVRGHGVQLLPTKEDLYSRLEAFEEELLSAWRLADGTEVEILNWLDDHSRDLLSCTVHRPVRGDDVVAVLLTVIDDYGPAESTLTDNGSVYTSRFTGGRNAFEYVLPLP